MKLLTVGDGDLSLSLALARAYPQHSLTATVLVPDQATLIQTYPVAAAYVVELKDRSVDVMYGIDATQLHVIHDMEHYDYVFFHHPHLGNHFQDETTQAEQHRVLLCHYLYAASQVADNVHVCLCQSQADTWRLIECATRLGLKSRDTMPTTRPLLLNPQDPPENSSWAAPRRYRNGQTGSRHFLGKYGYCHRRTHGRLVSRASNDTNVKGSLHYIFQKESSNTIALSISEPFSNEAISSEDAFECPICSIRLDSLPVVQGHLQQPAVPMEADTSTVSIYDTLLLLDGEHPINNESHHFLEADHNGVYTIDEAHANIRLRTFLHKHTNKSKNSAKSLVKEGLVSIDDAVVTDSARRLQTGMRVAVKSHASHAIPQPAPLDIRYASDNGDFVVVYKPVGLRAKGIFDGTLEYNFQSQFGKHFECLSKLDTGCGGLCLFAATKTRQNLALVVEHTFTALVYGRVPENLVTAALDGVQLPVDQMRRWKHNCNGSTLKQTACTERDYAHIYAVSIASSGVALSTLSIVTRTLASSPASIICRYLRNQLGHPVVGDKFAAKEYLSLPRAVRNRLKERLCLGCTQVSLRFESADTSQEAEDSICCVQDNIPDRWNALYWQDFCSSSTTVPILVANT